MRRAEPALVAESCKWFSRFAYPVVIEETMLDANVPAWNMTARGGHQGLLGYP